MVKKENYSEMMWRDIVGYVGLYLINSSGDIWSIRRSRLLRGGLAASGYKQIQLWKNRTGSNRYVHRLVHEAFIGPIKDGLDVCHRDGIKHNNDYKNLYSGTRKQNVRDAIEAGVFARGTVHSLAKLSEREVVAIRRLSAASAISNKELSTAFNVSASTIDRVVREGTYKNEFL